MRFLFTINRYWDGFSHTSNIPDLASLLFYYLRRTTLGSPVSLDYFDRAPFAFNGVIQRIITSYPSAEEPTVLNWSRNLNGGLTLTVPAGMVLETSTNLADTWEVLPVAGTVEIIPDPAEKARFFRLRRNN